MRWDSLWSLCVIQQCVCSRLKSGPYAGLKFVLASLLLSLYFTLLPQRHHKLLLQLREMLTLTEQQLSRSARVVQVCLLTPDQARRDAASHRTPIN